LQQQELGRLLRQKGANFWISVFSAEATMQPASPDGATSVSKDQWRAAFEAEDTSRRGPDALRMAFNRALKTTIENGQVNDATTTFGRRSERTSAKQEMWLVQILFVSKRNAKSS
jgi:hypothetical protein